MQNEIEKAHKGLQEFKHAHESHVKNYEAKIAAQEHVMLEVKAEKQDTVQEKFSFLKEIETLRKENANLITASTEATDSTNVIQ